MFGLGLPELLVLALAAGLLFFGSSHMLDFSRSLGRLSGEFKKGKRDIERELMEGQEEGGDKQSKNDNA